jgi:hypothetical protein
VLTDYLKKMAGVSSIQTGPSIMKPVIHGMHSQRVVIMNAGIRQEGQQWGSEHAPEIDPFIADRLTVVKGASSIRYGSDAVGGVILVEPRKLPHEPGLQAELNLVGMSNGRQGIASGLVEQHLGKFFDVCWRLQGTVKHAGNLSTPDLILENTAFREYNWSSVSSTVAKPSRTTASVIPSAGRVRRCSIICFPANHGKASTESASCRSNTVTSTIIGWSTTVIAPATIRSRRSTGLSSNSSCTRRPWICIWKPST